MALEIVYFKSCFIFRNQCVEDYACCMAVVPIYAQPVCKLLSHCALGLDVRWGRRLKSSQFHAVLCNPIHFDFIPRHSGNFKQSAAFDRLHDVSKGCSRPSAGLNCHWGSLQGGRDQTQRRKLVATRTTNTHLPTTNLRHSTEKTGPLQTR